MSPLSYTLWTIFLSKLIKKVEMQNNTIIDFRDEEEFQEINWQDTGYDCADCTLCEWAS